MKKILFLLTVLMVISSVYAAMEHDEIDYDKIKSLIESGIDCEKLSDKQLVEIGEYYMEKMHPGDEHDRMADMMGLHESDKVHDDFHIRIAKMMYCGNNKMMPAMMGNMMNLNKPNVAGGDMMDMMGSGMMGNQMCPWCGGFGWFGMIIFLILLITLTVVSIFLAIWLYKQIKK